MSDTNNHDDSTQTPSHQLLGGPLHSPTEDNGLPIQPSIDDHSEIASNSSQETNEVTALPESTNAGPSGLAPPLRTAVGRLPRQTSIPNLNPFNPGDSPYSFYNFNRRQNTIPDGSTPLFTTTPGNAPAGITPPNAPASESSHHDPKVESHHESNHEDDPIAPGYVCRPYPLALKGRAPTNPREIFEQLGNMIGDTNNDLNGAINKFYNQQRSANADITLGECVDRQFELLRHWIDLAAKAYEEQEEETEKHRRTLRNTRLNEAKATSALQEAQNTITTLEKENQALYTSVQQSANLIQQLKNTPTKNTSTTTNNSSPLGDSPNTGRIDITIPKALRVPLAAHPIPIFNGGGDIELTFEFIRAIEHHARLLDDDFNDAQKIKYVTTYLQGSVLQWAMEDWKHLIATAGIDPSWLNFLNAFRSTWVSENSHVYLTNKLEKMELKGNQIDQFNHNYTTTLHLLNRINLSAIPESDQYYQIYVLLI
ncbi:hypothetical protein BJ508DRAFT_335522 [Ascobolus immersus RN42]|uniref:Ty3 transposon capsid-like protein domain-containing protein n=1 Tax=Ascobolus immersus RN42 TaxID=1160509 RepID=A0A3N4HC19_ASCIM|nr:hypothetical protein BJ508DRAFT_335522 [Ascobolus immersus RN42]